jgi:penicillin-binding protein 2
MYWTRLKILLVLVALVMVILAGRLAQLQLIASDDYVREARANLTLPAVLTETRRGSIVDRQGLVLAGDAPQFDLCMYYPFLAVEDTAFAARLARRRPKPGTPQPAAEEILQELAPHWQATSVFVRRQADAMNLTPEEYRKTLSNLWLDLASATGFGIDLLDDQRLAALRGVAGIKALRRRNQEPIREESVGRRGIAHPILSDLDEQTKAAVGILEGRYSFLYEDQHGRHYPALVVQEHAKRHYPYGDCAAHVVGYIGEVSQKEVGESPDHDLDPNAEPDSRRVYHLHDQVGKEGIEASMERYLRGTRGLEQYDKANRFLSQQDPKPGDDVHLTIDVAYQTEVEAALAKPDLSDAAPGYMPRGAAVVIDLRDGGVLAMASVPRFNPASLSADYPDLIAKGSGEPLLHRAIAGQLPPGSVFKIVTASAGLSEGKITTSTTFNCTGFFDPEQQGRWKCWNWRTGGHGEISLHRALSDSCDVYFYHVGLKLGVPAMVDWGRRFGFGTKIGLELPGEQTGEISLENHPCNLAIGQGKFTATPLQVARMCALAATGGRLSHEVHLVEAPQARPLPPVDLGLSPAVVAAIRSGMVSVVNDPGATGYKTVHSSLLTIAGKSGSAESRGNTLTHSWFVAYAPAENPQVAVAVVFEHAGGGSKVAGPVAKKIIETALRQGLIRK